MTTIVYRDGIMAGDSSIFDRDTYCGAMVKVHKNADGWLFGSAGELGHCVGYRDWFLGGMKGQAPEIKDDEAEALIVDPEGRMFWYGHRGQNVEVAAEYAAIGSGFSVAMGALAGGSSALEAIGIACDLNCYTRRPIHSVRLDT